MKRIHFSLLMSLCAVACGPVPEPTEAPTTLADGVATPAGHGADLTGVWTNDPPEETRAYQNSTFTAELPAMTPWAREQYDLARPTFGAKSVPDTGYAFCGNVTAADTTMPRAQAFREGILVHIDAVAALALPGAEYEGGDLRLPNGRHNGSPSARFWITLAPGAALPRHRHSRCEKVYYVVRGQGIAGAGADRAAVRAGHVHVIPQDVEHFLCNTDAAEPLEVIGVMTGAGSLEDSGYEVLGAVPVDERSLSGAA